jgi:hypothetical protein
MAGGTDHAVPLLLRICFLPLLFQMAQLMAVMREFKRREMVGLAQFYAAKLGALEETLLVGQQAGAPLPAVNLL